MPIWVLFFTGYYLCYDCFRGYFNTKFILLLFYLRIVYYIINYYVLNTFYSFKFISIMNNILYLNLFYSKYKLLLTTFSWWSICQQKYNHQQFVVKKILYTKYIICCIYCRYSEFNIIFFYRHQIVFFIQQTDVGVVSFF